MTKSEVANFIRSRYPKALGIRKKLQSIKIKRLKLHYLNNKEIEICEKCPDRKEEVISPYLEKWKTYLKPTIKEMEEYLTKAPGYQGREDIEKIRTDILFCRLAYGFIPSEYISFKLEHKSPQERRKYMSDVNTLVFGYSVNDIKELQSIIDKGQSYKQFAKYFKRDAVVVHKEKDFTAFHTFVQNHPVFVQKRTNSAMGHNIDLVDIRTIKESEHEYFNKLIRIQKHLLEERVVQHEDMSVLNASSVNTVRCMTFYSKDGVVIPYCFLKAGRNGSFVDNAGSGGIVVGVIPETGVCGTDGFTEYGERFVAHPESGIVFKGFQIPKWNEMIELCKTIALEHPDTKYLSFDMAYTDKGWLVIEVNGIGQFIIPQIVWQRGIKEEVNRYLVDMEKVV